MSTKKVFKVGGLFSGVGGIESAFEQADYEIVWSNEYDQNACKTYRFNFPHHRLIEQNIWDLIDNNYVHDGKKLESVDILVAGFPCQAFSVAGYRKGFEDPRGNLFFAIKKFIKKFEPKALLLENVKNLEGHDNGNTFLKIRSELDKLKYSVIHKVLNTCDYTDIPQNRERIFIICYKNEQSYNDKPLFNEGKTVCSEAFEFPPKTKKPPKKIKGMLSRRKVANKYYYTENNYMYDDLKKTIVSRDTVYQWRRKYVRVNKSNLCPTLTANMGTGGHNVPLIIDCTGGIRKLTPKECFRFQGFNKIKLPEIANSSLYKQAGNSVTVPLVKVLAETIKDSLDKKYH